MGQYQVQVVLLRSESCSMAHWLHYLYLLDLDFFTIHCSLLSRVSDTTNYDSRRRSELRAGLGEWTASRRSNVQRATCECTRVIYCIYYPQHLAYYLLHYYLLHYYSVSTTLLSTIHSHMFIIIIYPPWDMIACWI
jgi:hypothetical protein